MPGMSGTPPLGPAAPPRVLVRTPIARRAVPPPRRHAAAALLVAVALAVVLALAAAPARAQSAGCAAATATVGAVSVAAVDSAIACLVNAERGARRLAPVRPAAALAVAARRHAADMVARGYFAHVSPSGGTLAGRARRAGYLDGPCWALGEDLGWAPPSLATAQAVVAAWMASPSHRSVILDPDFRDVGVGIAAGAPVGDGPGTTFVLEMGAVGSCESPARAAPRARVRAG